MTLSPWIIYLISVSDGVKECAAIVLIVMGFIGGIGAFFVPFILAETGPETHKNYVFPIIRKFLGAMLVAGIFYSLLPSQKTAATIIILPAIVNSEPVQKDLPELYNIAIEALKENLAPAKK